MFSALFPVHKNTVNDVLPCGETPGSIKNGGDNEKKEQFAKLLFVSLETADDGKNTTTENHGETPLWTNGTRSLTALAASLLGEGTVQGAAVIEDTAEEDSSAQTVPDDSLTSLFSSAFADAKGVTAHPIDSDAPTNEVISETKEIEMLPKQAVAGDLEFPSRNAQLLGETLLAKKTLPVDETPPHGDGKGAFALPDSFQAVTAVDPKSAVDPEIQEALGCLQATTKQTPAPAQEAFQSERDQAGSDIRAASLPVDTETSVHRATGRTGSENGQPETSLRPSFANAASQEGGKTPEIPDVSSAYARRTVSFPPAPAATTGTEANLETAGSKVETSGGAAPFSLSMTDNVRPRRSFVLTEQGAVAAESDVETEAAATSAPRASSRTQILTTASSQSAETGSAEKPVTNLSAATASERALKAAVEEKLSTNRLTEGREQEQGIFPAARNLFGEAEPGKTVPQAEAAQQQVSKPFAILKESLKGDDFGQQAGKEAAESAVYSSSPKPMQSASQQQVSFANLLSGETQLQGRGGAALEDGMQHVVRFLKTEGRQAASIIVDPPALGRIEIELVTIAKGVEASIKVASEQVRQLVQDNIVVLRNHLEQQGVHLGEFIVDLRDNSKGNSGHNTFTGGKKSRRSGASVSETESIDETVPSFRVDLEHGLLSWVA
jgi:flagellar hook-length control protein FliK